MLSSESNSSNNVELALKNPSSSNENIENNSSSLTTYNTSSNSINTSIYTNVVSSTTTITPSNTTTSIEESSDLIKDKISNLSIDTTNEVVIGDEKNNIDTPNNKLLELNKNSSIFHKMTQIFLYHREIICLMAIILTTYATYQNHINRAPNYLQLARPIFEESSKFIDEFSDGELTLVQQRVNLEELSVILFYAPWCAQSLYVRDYFTAIAKIYQNYFYFAAVNCWQPGGECRLQHSKVKTWPVMVAYYPKSTAAIQYNGPWKLGPMYKFLNSTLNPVQRIHNKDELANLQKHHTTIVIGFFRSIKSRYYCFYHAAVKWLERDPFQSIRFVVVTGKNLENFDVHNQTMIQITHINGLNKYFENDISWSVHRINNWIKKETRNLPQLWFNLNGNTNQSLMELLNKSPTLIFLTKHDWLNDNQEANHILLDVIRNNSIFSSNKFSIKTERELEKTDYTSDSILLRTPKVPLDIPNKQALTYVLLDIYMFYKFAIKLGVTRSNIQSNSSVVLIVDQQKESVFILKELISVGSIRQFAIDYKSNNLTRNFKLKSSLNDQIKSQHFNRTKNSSFAVEINIPEIDGKKFQQLVKSRTATTTTLILISSSTCSLCTFLMINLLKIAKALHNLNIEFYKIDGIGNDLTWQYTMGSFPSLVIFPIKNDVRVFPQYMVPNEKNLLGFILANLNSPLDQLLTLLSYCKVIKSSSEFQYCVKKSRILVNELIEINLRRWRLNKHNKDIINEETCLHNNFFNLRELYFILLDAKFCLKKSENYKFEKFLSKNYSDKNFYCYELKTK